MFGVEELISHEHLAALGAILTGVAGCITAYMAIKMSRLRGYQERHDLCLDELGQLHADHNNLREEYAQLLDAYLGRSEQRRSDGEEMIT